MCVRTLRRGGLALVVVCGTCAAAAWAEPSADGFGLMIARWQHEERLRGAARPSGEGLSAAETGGFERRFACYPSDLPPEEMEELIRETGLLPPMMMPGGQRFWRDVTVWNGNSGFGPPDRAQAARLTYSFPADGATWGGFSGRPTGANTLNAELMSAFGANDLDEGREYIRQALAAYEKHSGLRYTEVSDLGLPMSSSELPSFFHGDIRIGGHPDACDTCLAWNAFPTGDGIVSEGGGDMCIHTDYFTPMHFLDPDNNYRYFRNTISHEHGHGTGAIHSVPCNNTKNMEPALAAGFDMLQVDDRRGLARSYGDRFAGNHSSADAADLGSLDDRTGAPHSAVVRNVALNGVNGLGNTDEDWYRFEILFPHDVVVSASPTGGTYDARQQFDGCDGTGAGEIEASAAGNISLTLYNEMVQILDIANDGLNGSSESITWNNLPAGVYYVRVRDVGPNPIEDQYVQLYTLAVRVDGAASAPTAVAGIDKRCQAGKNCWFMGDINSYVNDSLRPNGALNFISTYSWDRDGDGVFEIANAAKTAINYVSNGVYTASLRVTDAAGRSDIDQIHVTVFGATTLVQSVAPSSGFQGATVPVVITGTNLKNVTSLSHIIPGAGITVTGTPTPNAMGTQVSGISFVIAPNAAVGPRNVGISNSDGSQTGFMTFAVVPAPSCSGDANNDGVVGFPDISAALLNWGAMYTPGSNGLGDADNDGSVGFPDISSILLNWGEMCG